MEIKYSFNFIGLQRNYSVGGPVPFTFKSIELRRHSTTDELFLQYEAQENHPLIAKRFAGCSVI
jgi:hypothetical protein